MGCSCAKESDSGRVYQIAGSDDTAKHRGFTTSTRSASKKFAPEASTRTDICGLLNNKYIIQSGTHYIEVLSLKDEVSVSDVKPLPEVLKNGDHYLAWRRRVIEYVGGTSSTLSMRRRIAEEFYIIKGSSCIQVDQLLVIYHDSGCETIFELHPECRRGDFYFANESGFYIIRRNDNTYLQVQDMNKARYHSRTASRHKLHKSFKNGLYYFATEDYFYVLKESVEFGMVYHRTKDLRSNESEEVLTVSPSIAKFMQNSPLDQQGRSSYMCAIAAHYLSL